jgi:aryl-alcohol dehydrogenase-like predicted oxidoreductase
VGQRVIFVRQTMHLSPNLTSPELGLGTAQFGLPYGISNTVGQTSFDEAREILLTARSQGIRYLDTAVAYGSSEEVLGRLATKKSDWRIVTKLPTLPQALTDSAKICRWVHDNLTSSLRALRCQRVYGVLVHNALDAIGPYAAAIFEGLMKCVDRGLVCKVGASLYDQTQLKHVVTHHPVNLIQIPANVFDQRLMVDNTLLNLRQRGIEIHARSIFLQGLVLMRPEDTPRYFDPIRAHLARFRQVCEEQRVLPVVMALSFIRQLPVDVALVGVNSKEHLDEISRMYHGTAQDLAAWDFSQFMLDDPAFINPALWRL